MKNTNKKGFTLVELVIVIAVIAILAGVLIATFATVIKRANQSAEVQNIKNAEIAQKADDIITKIENSNWLGWEDFEASIVSKIAEVVKRDSVTGSLTADQVREIVNDAVATIKANIDQQNTGVTEDQIKAIVENAIGTLRYEGVTEAQVRAIVKAALNEVTASQLQAAQVKAIVNAANANNLTAADILVALQAGNFASTSDVNTAVGNVTTAIGNATAGLATKAQAEAILEAIEAINVNATTNELDDVITAKALNIRIKNAGLTSANTAYDVVSAIEAGTEFNSKILLSIEQGQLGFFVVDSENKLVNSCGLNIAVVDSTTKTVKDAYKYWSFVDSITATGFRYSQYLLGDKKTDPVTADTGIDVGKNFSITSVSYTSTTGNTVVVRTTGGTLKINAPSGTVNHYGYAEVLDVQAIDGYHSYHEFGILSFARIKQGHFVVESEGVVNVLYATGAKTEVRVDNNNGVVGQAYATNDEIANYDTNGVTPKQDGNVVLVKDESVTEAVITAVTSDDLAEVLTSNATLAEIVENSTFRGTGEESDPYIISSANELVLLSNKVTKGNNFAGKWFALSRDIDMKDILWGADQGDDTINCIGLSSGTKFCGNFDGKGYTISNLSNGNKVTSDTYTNPTSGTVGNAFGLFGYVSGGTQESPIVIKNLSVNVNADIPAGKACAALIASLVAGSHIKLENITVSGKIFARDEKAAGFIGVTNGNGSSVTMTKCVNEVNVQGTQRIAGFISQTGSDGGADIIRFINCQNKGNISLTKVNEDYQTNKYGVAAGFVSHTNGATITYDNLCLNTGTIDAPLAADFQTHVASGIKYNGNGTWSYAGKPGNVSIKGTLGMKGVHETDYSKAYFKTIEDVHKIQDGFDGIFYHSNTAYSVYFYGDNRFESPIYNDIADKYTAEEWNAKTYASDSGIEDDSTRTMTIVLQNDLNWNALYTIGTSRTLIIDLNGYTLTASSSILKGLGATNIIFKNGVINATGVKLVDSGYSTVTFENTVTGNWENQ